MPPLLALPLSRISHSPERPGAGAPKLQTPAEVISAPVPFEMTLPSGDDTGSIGADVCAQPLPFHSHQLPQQVASASTSPPSATSRMPRIPPSLALPWSRINHSPGRPGAGPPKLQVPAEV